jgi:hypothetical protein
MDIDDILSTLENKRQPSQRRLDLARQRLQGLDNIGATNCYIVENYDSATKFVLFCKKYGITWGRVFKPNNNTDYWAIMTPENLLISHLSGLSNKSTYYTELTNRQLMNWGLYASTEL